MAGSINKVILLGRLGGDPEIRVSQDGNKIAKFSLATSENWKDKSTNEKKERTEWHKVVIFSPGLADISEKYLRKGSLIYLEGQIRSRKYTDQSGVEKYITEVVIQGYNSNLTMLDGRNKSDNSNLVSENKSSLPNDNLNQDSTDLDDEIPF